MAPGLGLSVNNNRSQCVTTVPTFFSLVLRCSLQLLGIAPKHASHPENHDAICSDPCELAAPKSFHRDESGIQAAQSGAVAFVVIFGPWFHDVVQTRARHRGRSCDDRKLRVTLSVVPL